MTDIIVFDFVNRKVLLRSPDGTTREAPPVIEMVGTSSAPPHKSE